MLQKYVQYCRKGNIFMSDDQRITLNIYDLIYLKVNDLSYTEM